MALTRPFSMRSDLNRIFNELEQEFFSPLTGRRLPSERGMELSSVLAPAVDVLEEDKDIKVKAQVPGIKPENLEIEVDNNLLTISGESESVKEREKGNIHRQEIIYGKFYRQIPLPTEVQSDKAKADFENGILTVTIPKSEQTRRHRIQVSKK